MFDSKSGKIVAPSCGHFMWCSYTKRSSQHCLTPAQGCSHAVDVIEKKKKKTSCISELSWAFFFFRPRKCSTWFGVFGCSACGNKQTLTHEGRISSYRRGERILTSGRLQPPNMKVSKTWRHASTPPARCIRVSEKTRQPSFDSKQQHSRHVLAAASTAAS